jgi:hypothetical protein
MKVKDLLNYLINYGEEGFSLEDNVKVRMFMHHGKAGKRGDYVDYKDCEPSCIGGDEIHLIINEDEGDYWQWDEAKKK